MAATSQPISIQHGQRSGVPSSTLSPSLAHIQSSHLHNNSPLHNSPLHAQSSLLGHNAHLANPRWAGTSPRSAESSTSWSIHPGPLFVSAGSLGSTSGSLGAGSVNGSVGSYRAKMYPSCSPAAPVLNPLDPEFKFRGTVGSLESDHGSLINPHMSEREFEQYRNFACCGLPLNDLHALVEHFETNHVFVVDQNHTSSQLSSQHAFAPSTQAAASGSSTNGVPTRLTDSSLAGALGPSGFDSATATQSSSSHIADGNNATGSAASGFDLDDIDMEMEPEPEPETATSPAPSASSSSNSNPNSSTRSSPLGGIGGPLPLTQPQRFANANGIGTNGTGSSVSSPPDTPLLTTPVSPFANAASSTLNPTFPWSAQANDGLTTPVGLAQNQSVQGQGQSQGQMQPAGPSAFDTVHLPPKHSNGGMFSHPYASAASAARRHHTHPLSPLSSSSSIGTSSGATSPSSGYPPNGNVFGGFSAGQLHRGLHHTQSLYALKLARQSGAEDAQAELVARALNGYSGYEDYSRGFPGTGDATGSDVGIAGGLGTQDGGNAVGPTESAIHPGLLFGNANGVSGTTNAQVKVETTATSLSARDTPAQSRSGSPLSTPGASSSGTAGPSGSSAGPTRKMPQSSTTLSRPSSSLLLSKPFKCPTPGCTKSYKQANGLKYHVTHGQCSFTPPPELSSISELGLAMGVNLKLGPMGIEGLEGMSEAERREAEREAERRLKPFCCQVKPCTRRYKNMNGLRYHYQHSGEHGQIGLRMLASGRHDATRSQSAERDADEEGYEVQQRGEEGGGNGGERGRKKERSGGGIVQTSSAPSTPGSSQQRNASGQFATPFAFQQQHQHHQQMQHQRSLSGSGMGISSQPVSPLSQHFSVPPTPTTASAVQTPFSQAQAQFVGQQRQQHQQMMNNAVQQFGFSAVQSQPASAYASPWGSRSGSPTSGVGVMGVNGSWGQGGDASMAS